MADGRLQSSRDDRHRDRNGDARGDRRDRRRSRSPAHRSDRRGGGSSYQESGNSYSSSRSYRDREREERYTGRDRGDADRGVERGGGGSDRRDREWDRDRGSARRDARRDDDDRRRDSRRDREDPYDRRRPPRDDFDRRDADRERGRDREDERQLMNQASRKSASPVRKPKEPTPPLDDVISILERKRRLTQWDIKPAGYENVTAEQAKLSGLFPLPGAPRQQQMDPAKLQAFMNAPGNQASGAALKPSTARQSKRLLVYNLPSTATDEMVLDFFNMQMNPLNITRSSDPCISAQVSKTNGYALLEFKTPEDATTALALRNLQMPGQDMDMSGNGVSNGSSGGMLIKRPKDYIAPIVQDETENESGLLSNVVPDTQNKIVIHNLPSTIESASVVDLVSSFGELKNFILVEAEGEPGNRGFAFCEFKNTGSTDAMLEGLNGLQLGDKPLVVERASIGLQQATGEMSVNAMSLMAGGKNKAASEGRVLCLMNMITPEELMDAEEAAEILEDVKEEVAKYGKLLDVKMPRPTGGSRMNTGVGKIYLKYESPASASKALAALAGRKFADRTVVVTYFGEEYFDVNAW